MNPGTSFQRNGRSGLRRERYNINNKNDYERECFSYQECFYAFNSMQIINKRLTSLRSNDYFDKILSKSCICPNFFVTLHAFRVQRQQRKKKTENNNYGKEGIELERYDGEMAQ